MLKHKQFRTRGSQQSNLANNMASTVAVLADIEPRRSNNHANAATISEQDCAEQVALPGAEDVLLRCLGAALIMRWNTLPAKLQKELADDAGDMHELLEAPALRGQIARFVRVHENDQQRR